MKKGQVWLLVGLGAVFLAGIGALFGVFRLVAPPPGPPVASTPVLPNTAFTTGYPSDGRPMRALLDYDCDMTRGTGSLPIEGRIELSAGGLRAGAHEVDTASGVWTGGTSEIGGRHTGTGYVLFDVAAHAAGTPVQLTGVLIAPTGCQMRVYVAP